WRERDLPEKQRTKHVHRLHPYLGKFIPQLVEVFLRKYFQPGQTVADPFAGSGTTLVQANELGIHSIGYDISAFNVLLMRAKTERCDPAKLESEVRDAINAVRRTNCTAARIPELDDEMTDDEPVDSDYLRHWYAPEALRELLTFRSAIMRANPRYELILKVILCRAARSARITTHFDLDFPKQPTTEPYYCYKHSRTCEPTRDAMKFLERYAADTVARVAEFQALRTDADVTIIHADSAKARVAKIDGIITSPPYVGLIDYHEQHAYAYHLLGLKDRRSEEIGAAANGQSERAKRKYQEAIANVFDRFVKKMPSGGPIIVVAGDKHNLYPRIAELIGVETEAVLHRHVNRRTGRRNNAFFESVFIWRKR